MPYLLVDIGNSFIKYALCTDGLVAPACIVRDIEFLDKLEKDELKVAKILSGVILVSVADNTITNNIKAKLVERFDCLVQQIKTSKKYLGLTCGYFDYFFFGADRWVAMIAAWQHSQKGAKNEPLLVVDCGTVLTADVVDAKGLHLGGWMMPSALLMRDMLEEKSSGIHLGLKDADLKNCNNEQHELLIGQSTQQCIVAGGMLAQLGFIKQCFSQAEDLLGTRPLCFLTGGGAKDVVPLLTVPVEHLPNLVLDGLALFIE